jgi:DNA-damage-inducible protein J
VKRVNPNAETLAALAECNEMKKHPEQQKQYHSFVEIMDDVFPDG